MFVSLAEIRKLAGLIPERTELMDGERAENSWKQENHGENESQNLSTNSAQILD